MKFLIKIIDQKDPTKITEKEEHAANEKELVEMYKFLGYNIEIVEQMGEPSRTESILANPPQPGSGVIADETANYRMPEKKSRLPQSEMVFTDGTTQFKMEDNVMYKKDWVAVNPDEYRIINKRIEKLDWVALEQPKPAEPEPEPEPAPAEPEPLAPSGIMEVPSDLDIPICDN